MAAFEDPGRGMVFGQVKPIIETRFAVRPHHSMLVPRLAFLATIARYPVAKSNGAEVSLEYSYSPTCWVIDDSV